MSAAPDHSVHDACAATGATARPPRWRPTTTACPSAAIAQEPVEPRSAARLLVGPGLSRGRRGRRHATVADLPGLLGPGDVLVVNDTRVLAARLDLVKGTGGRAEVLLVEPLGPAGADGTTEWAALVRPGRRLPAGHLVVRGRSPSRRADPVVEVGEPVDPDSDPDPDGAGTRRVRLLDSSVVARSGSMPLPPYIHRALADPDRYQTVYAGERDLVDRSAAAPTAGLHLTPELLAECEAAGARLARVDLAIGLDTFRPVTADTAEDHVIHTERYSVPAATVAACAGARRVVAVGTTSVRALESAAATGVLAGRTDLYIHGEFEFRVVDVLVTNFHLPRSSLLLLVEAFCGPVLARPVRHRPGRGLPVPLLRRRHGRGPRRGQGHPGVGRARRDATVNPLRGGGDRHRRGGPVWPGGHAAGRVPGAGLHAGGHPGIGQGAGQRRPGGAGGRGGAGQHLPPDAPARGRRRRRPGRPAPLHRVVRATP